MLNLHRDKKIVRREPGRDGKILCDHRQDGNDEVHRLEVRRKKKGKKKRHGGEINTLITTYTGILNHDTAARLDQ